MVWVGEGWLADLRLYAHARGDDELVVDDEAGGGVAELGEGDKLAEPPVARPDREVVVRVLHHRPPRVLYANEARIIFEYAENWCGQQTEDALNEEKFDEDYDVRANMRSLGTNHYMAAPSGCER